MFQNSENESISPSCQFAAVLQTRNSAIFEVIATMLLNTQDLWSIMSCLMIKPDVSAEERSAHETSVTVRDYRLPPRCKLDLRSSGMLRSVDWWLPTFRSHLQVSDRTTWPFTMGLIGCQETSVTNYQSTLLNIPEYFKLQQQRFAHFLATLFCGKLSSDHYHEHHRHFSSVR